MIIANAIYTAEFVLYLVSFILQYNREIIK